MQVIFYLLCCVWRVGSTVQMDGGVVPLMVYVNYYFRLMHVLSVETLLCNTLYQYTCKQLIVR